MSIAGRYLLDAEGWRVRIGQIETVLNYFGSLCSITITMPTKAGTTHDVYLQARRIGGGTEIELIGNQYLPESAQLKQSTIDELVRRGWTATELPASPLEAR